MNRQDGTRSFFVNPFGGCQTFRDVTGKGTDEAAVVVTGFCTGPRDEVVYNVNCTMATARLNHAGLKVDIADPAFWQVVQPAEYVACLE